MAVAEVAVEAEGAVHHLAKDRAAKTKDVLDGRRTCSGQREGEKN